MTWPSGWVGKTTDSTSPICELGWPLYLGAHVYVAGGVQKGVETPGSPREHDTWISWKRDLSVYGLCHASLRSRGGGGVGRGRGAAQWRPNERATLWYRRACRGTSGQAGGPNAGRGEKNNRSSVCVVWTTRCTKRGGISLLSSSLPETAQSGAPHRTRGKP